MKFKSIIVVGLALQLTVGFASGIPLLEATPEKVVKLAPPPTPKRPPTILVSDIKPLINSFTIIDPTELNESPIVMSSLSEEFLLTDGDKFLANRLTKPAVTHYLIVQTGKAYQDPITKQVLGYSAVVLAEAKLVQAGTPAALQITKSYCEVKVGNRLLPKPVDTMQKRLVLYKPKTKVNALVIANLSNMGDAASHNVVLINQGLQQGLQAGAVLAIQQAQYGSDKIGELVIIKSYPQLSLGLISQAQAPIKLLDKVVNLP
jgi:hypothetical protein